MASTEASTESRFTIVVGIDFSETGNLALDHALEHASRRGDADVHVVFVEDELTTPRYPAAEPGRTGESDDLLERVRRQAQERLDHLAKQTTLQIRHVVAHVRRGSPASQIVQLASHLDADLLVVGTHGRSGLSRFFMGSVAERVVRIAHCPVFVVRPKDHQGLGEVPQIEPPCPECVKTRRDTGGTTLWCARHSEHHIRPHTYHYVTTGMYSNDRIATRSGETTPNQQH